MSTETVIKDRHWQTQALVDAFIALKENAITTYQQLAETCKVDVATVMRRFQSAKKIARRDHHILIEPVRGVGVERLPQEKVVVPVSKARNRMRSAARTSISLIKHGVTDFAKLPADVKTTLYMERAIAGTVMLATDKASRRVLKEHAETSNGDLNIGRTLELLK